jgi:hypothetical protein
MAFSWQTGHDWRFQGRIGKEITLRDGALLEFCVNSFFGAIVYGIVRESECKRMCM